MTAAICVSIKSNISYKQYVLFNIVDLIGPAFALFYVLPVPFKAYSLCQTALPHNVQLEVPHEGYFDDDPQHKYLVGT